MKTPLRCLALSAAAGVLLTAHAHAALIAVTPIGGVVGSDSRPFMIGWEFAVSSPTTFYGLGYSDTTGLGLVDSHSVAVFDSGTGTIIVQGVVASGTTDPLVDGFRIDPLIFTLGAGDYVIGGQQLDGNDSVTLRATSVVSIPTVSYEQERELQTSLFVMPTNNDPANEAGIFGPDLLASPLSVPEPSSAMLMLAALLSFGFIARSRTQRD